MLTGDRALLVTEDVILLKQWELSLASNRPSWLKRLSVILSQLLARIEWIFKVVEIIILSQGNFFA